MRATSITCDNCKTVHRINEEHLGKTFACPICRSAIVTQEPEELPMFEEPEEPASQYRAFNRYERKQQAKRQPKEGETARLMLWVISLCLPMLAAGYCDGIRGLVVSILLLLFFGWTIIGLLLPVAHALWCVESYYGER